MLRSALDKRVKAAQHTLSNLEHLVRHRDGLAVLGDQAGANASMAAITEIVTGLPADQLLVSVLVAVKALPYVAPRPGASG